MLSLVEHVTVALWHDIFRLFSATLGCIPGAAPGALHAQLQVQTRQRLFSDVFERMGEIEQERTARATAPNLNPRFEETKRFFADEAYHLRVYLPVLTFVWKSDD